MIVLPIIRNLGGLKKTRPKRPTKIGRNDPGPKRPRLKQPRPKQPRAETTQSRNDSGQKRPWTITSKLFWFCPLKRTQSSHKIHQNHSKTTLAARPLCWCLRRTGRGTTTDMLEPYWWICISHSTVFRMTSSPKSCQPLAFLRQHSIFCKVICQTENIL